MKAVTKTGQDVVEASYKAADGSIVTGQWESLDAEAVAAGRPWRTFPWYLGQKNYAGLYWCATQNAHVGYESRLELSRLMLADFDPTARKIVSQPFQLRGIVGGERIRRVPDYMVCTDSGPLVIDVKPVRALQDPRRIASFRRDVSRDRITRMALRDCQRTSQGRFHERPLPGWLSTR